MICEQELLNAIAEVEAMRLGVEQSKQSLEAAIAKLRKVVKPDIETIADRIFEVVDSRESYGRSLFINYRPASRGEAVALQTGYPDVLFTAAKYAVGTRIVVIPPDSPVVLEQTAEESPPMR